MKENPGPGYADHPEHKVTITPYEGLVTIEHGGQAIANSHRALVLHESGYRPVHYVPRQDIRMDRLTRSAEHTGCPFKGEATYFTLTGEDRNIAWSYERPYDEVASIQNHLAFYSDRVDVFRALPNSHERIPPS